MRFDGHEILICDISRSLSFNQLAVGWAFELAINEVAKAQIHINDLSGTKENRHSFHLLFTSTPRSARIGGWRFEAGSASP
jgi:hypothetical protein